VGSGGTSSETPRANYYDNDETTYGWNGRKCGLLYNWQALHYLDENSDTMLPDGWRVPTKGDWTSLTNEVGGSSTAGTKLKAANVSWASSWGGTDDYRFSVLPAGYYDNNSENYYYSGTGAFCWMSTIDNVDNNEYVYFQRFSTNASSLIVTANQSNKYSVRLVRDYPPPVTIGGRSYKTVKMPDGKVWLAENLDWKFDGLTFRDGTEGNEMDSSLEPRAAYYNYDESTYGAEGNKYGLLYNWGAADYINDHWLELGLPEGWHVASPEEWQELFDSIGEDTGKKLKSTTGWRLPEENGTDEYGFGAVPAGKWSYGGASYENPAFVDLTADGYLWTSYREEGGYASSVDFYCNSDDAYSSIDYPAMARSLRLVYTPPTELNLPLNTIRMQLANGPITPTRTYGSAKANFTKVEGTEDIYDCQLTNMGRYSSVSFEGNNEILGILGAKLHGNFSINSMFSRCSSIKYILNFDASNCIQAESVFSECTSLICVNNLNLSTDHRYGDAYEGYRASTFAKCSNLKHLNNINITGATSVNGFFYNCKSIEEIPLLDTRIVTNMASLFEGCIALTKVPLLDSSKVTSMGYMFSTCYSLKKIPLFDTSKVTSMMHMFSYCKVLEEVPLLNTSSVTDMSYMFLECKALVTIPQFNTSNVTNMNGYLYSCSSLTSIPLLDTRNVTNMASMFYGCKLLVDIPQFNTSNVTNMNEYLYACSSLTSIPLLDTSKVTNMSDMFNGCKLLVDIPQFNTSNVTNMKQTFANCTSITTIPLLDTSKVTNMRAMLYGCENLTTVPLLDTSQVTDMGYMFFQCRLLSEVPNFDTRSLTAMDFMFYRTRIRTTPSFNTSNVLYMQKAFYDISYLKTIELFNTDSAIDVRSMFEECDNVESGALALYQQMSTQTNPPTDHSYCFACGYGTPSGRNERAQIPTTWGGTMSA
jgi:uncharacterized protein (TIGR02145 family)